MSCEKYERIEEWTAALRRAALPGTVTVTYGRQTRIEDNVPTTAHRLTSVSANGTVIGDDRDYDLLKAVMMPLEALSERETADPFNVSLNLQTGALSIDE